MGGRPCGAQGSNVARREGGGDQRAVAGCVGKQPQANFRLGGDPVEATTTHRTATVGSYTDLVSDDEKSDAKSAMLVFPEP
jgi:hypothetical protein